MKNVKSIFYFTALFSTVLWPIACTNNISTPSLPNPAATTTFTATPTATVAIPPMGLWVAGGFGSSITDASLYGSATPVTLCNTQITLSINRNAESTAAITLTTPIEGAVPITFMSSTNMGSYWISQYGTSFQYTYVINGTYSIAVSTSLGTVTSTMSAPGGLTFDATGASVTATYPGNLDQAEVDRSYPSPVTTFKSPAGVNLGSPYSYPASAYNSPSFPATFGTIYSTTLLVPFTSPAAAGSTFIGTGGGQKYFAR